MLDAEMEQRIGRIQVAVVVVGLLLAAGLALLAGKLLTPDHSTVTEQDGRVLYASAV